jgi:bifunctional non-homologous end joining protein LigD
MKVGRRRIDVSSRDRVYFPGAGLTKGDLMDYYREVAPQLLPHARGRLVSMQRFPEGIDGPGFYQKEVPDHFPGWIHSEEVEKQEGTLRQLVIDNAPTLVYLADQGCITPHVWLSRVDRVRHPDRMVFDLDPSGEDAREVFPGVRRAALQLRNLLDEVGLVPFLMTSGSRGLHIHVPLDREADFDEVRSFAADLADVLVARDPRRLTRAHRKEKRGDRIFLDVLRNAYAQTAVVPYGVRARAGAPVAVPILWEELEEPGMHAGRFTIRDVPDRMARMQDPWKGMGKRARGLGRPRWVLDRMMEEGKEGNAA